MTDTSKTTFTNLPSDLINVRVASKILQCNSQTLDRWIQQGKIRAWRRLGRYMVSRADAEALFQPVVPVSQDHAPSHERDRTDKQRQRDVEEARKVLRDRGVI